MDLANLVLCCGNGSVGISDDFTLLRLIMQRKILILLIAMCVHMSSIAQCAMCRATAEQASQENSGVAEGLNMGIVYLMGIPYLLFLIGGLVFFRKKIFAFFQK